MQCGLGRNASLLMYHAMLQGGSEMAWLGNGAQAVLYRCRTCRRIVASSANAILVAKGDGTFRGKRGGQAQRGVLSSRACLPCRRP